MSHNWFWWQTRCEGFLEAPYQSNHRTIADRLPISRWPISWIIWILISSSWHGLWLNDDRLPTGCSASLNKSYVVFLANIQSFCNMGHKGGHKKTVSSKQTVKSYYRNSDSWFWWWISAVLSEIADAESVRSELKFPTTTAALLFVVSEATISFVFSWK